MLYIIHENNEWLEPIREALIHESVPFQEWFLGNTGMIDLSEAPPEGVFFNRMSPSAHTRGHPRAAEYTSAVLDWLKRYKRKVINAYHVWQLETSKVLQYDALSAHGILVPRTIAAFSKADIKTAASRFHAPFILKHNRGGKGTGVQRLLSMAELDLYLDSARFVDSPDGITLVQEYIEAEEPCIYRLEFIDKKFVYALRVDTSGGFELCPADACTLEGQFCPTTHKHENKFAVEKEFGHPIVKQYQQFLTKENIDIAGIECIIDKQNRLFTYDINTNTNYNRAAEKHAGGPYAYRILAQYLRR